MSKLSLTNEQIASIEFEGTDLLVKGIPGSGKSVVLLQRAIRLHQKAIRAGEDQKIAILTFANSLVKYTKEVLDNGSIDFSSIDVMTMDKLCINVYKKVRGFSPTLISKEKDREKFVLLALQNVYAKTKSHHRFFDIDVEFWAKEFLWIKQKNIKTRQEYLVCERSGRGGKVRIARGERDLAYEIFEEYCKLIKQQRLFDWEDLYSYLIDATTNIPESLRYDHILIDEAQDLSFVKLKFGKMMARRSFTVAADKAQKIYDTSFSWKEIGVDIRGRASKTLNSTFRSTKQIVALAESLNEFNRALNSDQSEYTDPVLPETTGTVPCVIKCSSSLGEREAFCDLIKEHLKNEDVIGVLYRSYSDRDVIKSWLYSVNIKFEEINRDGEFSLMSPGVKLSTFHSSKGLEFDIVIIPRFADGIIPRAKELEGADENQKVEILSQERSFLYVGMTRAKYDLVFTYSGKVSGFLNEFDPDLYEHIDARGGALGKPFRIAKPVPINSATLESEEQEKIEIETKASIKIEEKENDQKTIQDPNSIKGGSFVIVEDCDTYEERRFLIDPDVFSAQKFVLGKRIGEVMEIRGKKYLIKQIFNE